MGTQYNKAKCIMGMLRKESYIWFRTAIDWVYSARLLCINCKHNKLQINEKCIRCILHLPKHLFPLFKANVRAVTQSYLPRLRGEVNKRRNN